MRYGIRATVSLLLLLVLCLTPGCGKRGGNPSEAAGTDLQATPDRTVPTESAPPSSVLDIPPGVTPQAVKKPEDPSKVYISLQNQDCDFYTQEYGHFVDFNIMTLEPYAIDQIHVSVPMQSAYTVSTVDTTTSEYNFSGELTYMPIPVFTPLQYLSMLQEPFDWAAYRVLEETVHAMYDQVQYVSDPEEHMQMLEEMNRLDQQVKNFTYEAQALFYSAAMPKIYVYGVNIRFSGNYTEETVEQVEVTVGDTTYTVDIGQWRFHATSLGDLVTQKNVGLSDGNPLVFGCSFEGEPHNGGYVYCRIGSISASRNVVLTGMRLLGDSTDTLLGARIRASGSVAGDGVDFYWDGETPVEIKSGQTMDITLYLTGESFNENAVNRMLYFLITYEADGRKGSLLLTRWGRRNENIWDSYIEYILGVDLRDRYEQYLAPLGTDSWIEDLPAGWVK